MSWYRLVFWTGYFDIVSHPNCLSHYFLCITLLLNNMSLFSQRKLEGSVVVVQVPSGRPSSIPQAPRRIRFFNAQLQHMAKTVPVMISQGWCMYILLFLTLSFYCLVVGHSNYIREVYKVCQLTYPLPSSFRICNKFVNALVSLTREQWCWHCVGADIVSSASQSSRGAVSVPCQPHSSFGVGHRSCHSLSCKFTLSEWLSLVINNTVSVTHTSRFRSNVSGGPFPCLTNRL